MLEHGGQLRAAAHRYGIPENDWLDLSTGINPLGWPVPEIPAQQWRCLPEENDGLEVAARAYYQARHVLPVPGSQAAIQILPALRPRSRVAVITPGYNEHAHAWRNAGHDVVALAPDEFLTQANQCDVAVLIHPNNPTGTRFEHAALRELHLHLQQRHGWLVVDEAFMDVTPEDSLAPFAHEPGLIVLRSLGKYFGLAGARVGFVCAEADVLAQIHARLGPWSVAGPSRWIATRALQDRVWQEVTRHELAFAQARLTQMLSEHGLTPHGVCALFQWRCDGRAPQWHEQLATRGILTRLFREPASLRFGLPGCEAEWNRLHAALREIAA